MDNGDRFTAELPHRPGVYIMKDTSGRVIYVGKALDLKKRVRSYFTGKHEVKTRVLVKKIAALEHIVTKNEYEALVLENNLIKQWSPRYNINLKDGKSYPVIRITAEPFPRVFRTRRIVRDGSDYFGPYANVKQLDVYLRAIDRLYPLRKCRGPLKKREHPCLYYHIGACPAPCCGRISREDYADRVKEVKRLFSGGVDKLLSEYRRRMKEASTALDFETAAVYRDVITSVEEVSRPQEVQDFDEEVRDYISCVRDESLYTFVVFQMRGGKLTGRELYNTESPAATEDALLDFVFQYYQGRDTLPSRLFLEIPTDERLLEEYFRTEHAGRVTFSVPRRGRHLSIIRMARENALIELEGRKKSRDRQDALRELKDVLDLPALPVHIEGFDIAQLGGTNPVASMVFFKNGKPDKKEYRRYRLRTLGGEIDDFESLREAVARRYTRRLNESADLPDLILVDGGKGQVSAVDQVLEALGIGHIPLVGLAKREEELFLRGRSEPVVLPQGNEALRVLQAVRDEAHRFATTLQKRLREKDVRVSVLEDIPGIGKSRAAGLLAAYGSVEAVAAAEAEDMAERAGIPLRVAEGVMKFFHQKNLTTGRE